MREPVLDYFRHLRMTKILVDNNALDQAGVLFMVQGFFFEPSCFFSHCCPGYQYGAGFGV